MKKLLEVINSLLRLKKAESFSLLAKAVRKGFSLQELKIPQEKKILIFSPHPDDDIFGMGGTILNLLDNNCQIKIIHLTDGSKGTISGIRDKRLIALRKKEAEKAMESLGVKDYVFWGYMDGNLPINKSTLRATETLINSFKPDIICLPSVFDDHPDHKRTNEIVTKILESGNMVDIQIWGYEIWSPGFYNRISDVSRKAKQKYRAAQAHESQQKCRDYLLAIQGLDMYRAKINGIGDYAEGFLVCPADIYINLYKKSI